MAWNAFRLVLAAVIAGVQMPAVGGDIGAGRAKELVHLVRQDCGSCHGLTLRGGLGPALTADALRDKPAEGLVATIMVGRPGSPMPPFRGILAEAEAEWVVEQLMRGFPEDGAPAAAANALSGTTR